MIMIELLIHSGWNDGISFSNSVYELASYHRSHAQGLLPKASCDLSSRDKRISKWKQAGEFACARASTHKHTHPRSPRQKWSPLSPPEAVSERWPCLPRTPVSSATSVSGSKSDRGAAAPSLRLPSGAKSQPQGVEGGAHPPGDVGEEFDSAPARGSAERRFASD